MVNIRLVSLKYWKYRSALILCYYYCLALKCLRYWAFAESDWAWCMDRLFRVNSPAVVAEIIDGEAVIMNLKSGNYFSTEGIGSVVWQWIEDGSTYGQMLASLAARFTADGEDVKKALAPFLNDLVTHELVREEAVEEVDNAAAPSSSLLDNLRGFSVPVLNVYADMKDLLLLDPIHDVSEVGWPTAKPEGEA
jgi:hypothetical protein